MGFGTLVVVGQGPIPLREGDPDLSYVDWAAATLAGYRLGVPVVLESTTCPTTAHDAFNYAAVLDSGTPILDSHHRLDGPSVEYL